MLGWIVALCCGTLSNPSLGDDFRLTSNEPIRQGLNAYGFEVHASDNDAPYSVIMVEAGKTVYRPHIIAGLGKIGQRSFSFPATLSELHFPEAPVLTAGGYTGRIGSALVPLGYLKSGGVSVSTKIHRNSWVVDSVLCIDPGKGTSAILDTSAEDEWAGFPDCVQTGPRILTSGINAMEAHQADEETFKQGREKYIQAPRIQLFACKSGSLPNSNFLIGITTEKVTLIDLVDVLPKLAVNKRKLCREVVALTGSISAGMTINEKLVAGSGSYLLESAIIFGPPSEKPK